MWVIIIAEYSLPHCIKLNCIGKRNWKSDSHTQTHKRTKRLAVVVASSYPILAIILKVGRNFSICCICYSICFSFLLLSLSSSLSTSIVVRLQLYQITSIVCVWANCRPLKFNKCVVNWIDQQIIDCSTPHLMSHHYIGDFSCVSLNDRNQNVTNIGCSMEFSDFAVKASSDFDFSPFYFLSKKKQKDADKFHFFTIQMAPIILSCSILFAFNSSLRICAIVLLIKKPNFPFCFHFFFLRFSIKL